MAGVRSKQLAVFSSTAAGTSTLYTVPSGYVTIVKSLYAIATASGTTEARLVLAAAGGPYVLLYWNTALGALTPASWTGWAVMNPGDKLQLYTTQAGLQIWASGAELPTTGL